MKVDKLIEKASDFFSGKWKKQEKKSKDLKNIIDQLVTNRDKLKKQHKNETEKSKKKEIAKEYKAVIKLIHKAKKRYEKIK